MKLYLITLSVFIFAFLYSGEIRCQTGENYLQPYTDVPIRGDGPILRAYNSPHRLQWGNLNTAIDSIEVLLDRIKSELLKLRISKRFFDKNDIQQKDSIATLIKLKKIELRETSDKLNEFRKHRNQLEYLYEMQGLWNPAWKLGQAMAFFGEIDDDEILKGLGSSGVSFAPGSGIIGATTTLSSIYILRGKVNVLGQLTSSPADSSDVSPQEILAQQIIGGGGNLVIQYLFPMGFISEPNWGLKWMVDFRNGIQIPAFGVTTSQVGYVGDVGLDFSAYLRDDNLRYAGYAQLRTSLVGGGNALQANLGLGSAKPFLLIQGTVGVQLFQPIQVQIQYTWSPRSGVRAAFPGLRVGLILTPEEFLR